MIRRMRYVPKDVGVGEGVVRVGARRLRPDAAVAVGAHLADLAALGGCDVLCANVGVQQFGAIDRLTPEDWQWVLSVNVFGTVNTVTSFLPSIRRADGA